MEYFPFPHPLHPLHLPLFLPLLFSSLFKCGQCSEARPHIPNYGIEIFYRPDLVSGSYQYCHALIKFLSAYTHYSPGMMIEMMALTLNNTSGSHSTREHKAICLVSSMSNHARQKVWWVVVISSIDQIKHTCSTVLQ